MNQSLGGRREWKGKYAGRGRVGAGLMGEEDDVMFERAGKLDPKAAQDSGGW